MIRLATAGIASLLAWKTLTAQTAAADGAISARISAQSAPDTTPQVGFGGFIDTYYAWDFQRPANFDRAYTTQPARHAEFNINLAYVDAKLAGPRYRGRLALQWGTSVQANYAGEPRLGGVSGPSVSQFIQEAFVGYQLAPTLWLDAGIFFSHIGYEGWISRDNPTYTRSLIADFSPYYEAGAKLTWAPAPTLTTTLAVVNGWQNVSNYNTPPATGVRVEYAPSSRLTLTYDNFLGNVAPDTMPARLRFFNEIAAQIKPTADWLVAAVLDGGLQGRSTANGGTAAWYGTSLIGRYSATDRLAVAGRLERYIDPDETIVMTGLGVPFNTSGASLGLDFALAPQVLWRSEVRGFWSSDPVWPTKQPHTYARRDGIATMSLAMRF
jgi:hypothetical protein